MVSSAATEENAMETFDYEIPTYAWIVLAIVILAFYLKYRSFGQKPDYMLNDLGPFKDSKVMEDLITALDREDVIVVSVNHLGGDMFNIHFTHNAHAESCKYNIYESEIVV